MVFGQKEYSWADVSYGVSAQTVGETLEEIEERDGQITKESFLDESRPEEAPTHALFEWNDAVAAERYRLVQSGHVLNNLVVKVAVPETEEPKTVKAFVNVSPGWREQRALISIHTAMEHMDTRNILLDHAKKELQAFQEKYNDLEELAAVFKAIKELKTA